MGLSWTIDKTWNAAFENLDERKPKVRNRIWATELDKAPIDVFLKMKGVKQTNPPDSRALRKMEAGNIWEEIVKAVLTRAGVMKASQEWVGFKYPNMLEVSGYLDIVAGGEIDHEKAQESLENEFSWLPDRTKNAFNKVVSTLTEEHDGNLREVIFEVKSTSSFMYDVYESKGRGSKSHELQLYHYLKSKDMKEGHLLYISRDDARMMEFGVLNPSPLGEEYKSRIKLLTDAYYSNTRPDLEVFIQFDEDDYKFRTNWRVMYSGYLTCLYGFEHQEQFRKVVDPKVNRFNRVFKRIVTGKNMTKANLEIIEEMKQDFPDYEKFIEPAKVSKKFDVNETQEGLFDESKS